MSKFGDEAELFDALGLLRGRFFKRGIEKLKTAGDKRAFFDLYAVIGEVFLPPYKFLALQILIKECLSGHSFFVVLL